MGKLGASSGELKDGRVLAEFENSVRQGFFKRVGVGLLTNACTRPQPRSPVLAYVPAVNVWAVMSAVYCRSGRAYGS